MYYPTFSGIVEIDEEDLPLISCFKWSSPTFGTHTKIQYARAYAGENKNIYMHRLILGFPEDDIDHIDGNGLNNTKSNLREVNQRINQSNRKYHRDGKLVGCSYDKTRDKWFANIRINGKTKYLGRYDTEQEAHNVYLKSKEVLENGS